MRDLFNIDNILQTLDTAAKTERMPMFDNMNFPFIAGRLQVYRNDKTWAVVFNTLALESGAGVMSIIDPIGPGVKMLAWRDYIDIPNLLGSQPKTMQQLASLQQQYQADQAGQVSENDQFIQAAELQWNDDDSEIVAIQVRGEPVSAAELASLKPIYNPDDYYSAYQLFETLIAKHKTNMLATSAEISRFFPDGLPPLLITLDDWHHPDLADEQLPSQCQTFQLLAKAIHSGRATDYAPTPDTNTNWRLWVDK